MSLDPLASPWNDIARAVLAAAIIYTAVIIYSRVIGLRAFSKISAFDFAITVAVGSMIGRVVLVDPTLGSGVVGLATLFGLQWLVSQGRRRFGLDRLVDNQPVLLLLDGAFQDAGMRRCRVTPEDVYEQVRMYGVTNLDDVAAVVMERTGDISVLMDNDGPIDPRLLSSVVGAAPEERIE